ncbi:MAG TPA: type II secretion system F family protein [Paraburkholderia sp.]|nr:type II secretion system F family protein [Paraburkholderia sp.]
MSSTLITAGVLLFVAVVLGCQSAYVWWNSRHGAAARRLQARLDALTKGSEARKEAMSILKSRRLSDASATGRLLLAMPGVRSLDAWLMQSGLLWSVPRLFATCAVFALAAAFACAMLSHLPLVVALAAAALCAPLPALYVRRRRARRLVRFEQQLPEICDMLGRALRAGHAFSSAIDMVGSEFAEPAGGEFRITFDEITYGVSLNDALCSLANRMPVNDLRYLVIAVLIQRDTGGNLAELLDSTAWLIRERLKLFDKVRVLSAEGRLSAWVLGLLPVGSAALISVLNPPFLEVFWKDPVGVQLFYSVLVSMLCGVFWVRRIVKIKA